MYVSRTVAHIHTLMHACIIHTYMGAISLSVSGCGLLTPCRNGLGLCMHACMYVFAFKHTYIYFGLSLFKELLSLHVCMHVCTKKGCPHTYIHACIHSYISACIHKYRDTIHACIYLCLPVFNVLLTTSCMYVFRTVARIYILSCMHTYIYFCMHAYIHTCMHLSLSVCVQCTFNHFTHMHVCIQNGSSHTYIAHACIMHMHIHAYTHTYMHLSLSVCV